MKATNKKTEQDVMAEYLEMMERGEGKEYVYTATTHWIYTLTADARTKFMLKAV